MRADLRVYKDAVEALEESTGKNFERVHKLAESASHVVTAIAELEGLVRG